MWNHRMNVFPLNDPSSPLGGVVSLDPIIVPVYDLAIGLVESHLVAAMTFSEFDVDELHNQ